MYKKFEFHSTYNNIERKVKFSDVSGDGRISSAFILDKFCSDKGVCIGLFTLYSSLPKVTMTQNFDGGQFIKL